METLDDKIKKFLAIDIGHGYGDAQRGNYDYQSDVANDCIGFGYGSGFDDESGNGCGEGDAEGYIDFRGIGSGCIGLSNGCGYPNGCGYGDGDGDGYGDSDNSGKGDGCEGVKEINGSKVYRVDNVYTIFTAIRGNVAKGYALLQSDLTLVPCFIVKENDLFAHGNTLRDAFNSLQEKLYDDSTEEGRIAAFKKKFPEYDVKYDNRDLFAYHHVLTGSCRMGRESFCKDKGLSLDGKTSVREFVELTQNDYGGDIIAKLPSAYGIE